MIFIAAKKNVQCPPCNAILHSVQLLILLNFKQICGHNKQAVIEVAKLMIGIAERFLVDIEKNDRFGNKIINATTGLVNKPVENYTNNITPRHGVW